MGLSIDLTQFCNCPNPCPTCCSVSACGCSSVPQILHATWSAGGACMSGFNGLVTKLTYNSSTQKWTGTQTACGETFTMAVHCDALTSKFQIDLNGGVNCTISVTSSSGTTNSCSPFQVTFGPFQINANAGCCCASNDNSLQIILTP